MVLQSIDLVCPKAAPVNTLNTSQTVASAARAEDECTTHPWLNVVGNVCVYWFTVELLLRFLVSPQKWNFIFEPYTIGGGPACHQSHLLNVN
jgi:hypothetical protein